MNGDDIKKLVPDLLDARCPRLWREAVEGQGPEMGWVVDLEDCVALVRAAQSSNPFIWIRGGIAHAIPRTEALALNVAAANKTLMVGRLYLAYGPELAMVAFDESIVAASLSPDFEPSMEDLVTRFDASLQYTRDWANRTIAEFGGRRFGADDWGLMAF